MKTDVGLSYPLVFLAHPRLERKALVITGVVLVLCEAITILIKLYCLVSDDEFWTLYDVTQKMGKQLKLKMTSYWAIILVWLLILRL